MPVNFRRMFNKYLYICAGLILVFFFRYSLIAIVSDTNVSGSKYIGLFVNGSQTNGYSHLVINEPYFRFGDKELSRCSHLDDRINGYLANHIEGWNRRTNFEFISEINSSGYRVYIKSEGIVVFLRGFSDFGGVPPSEAEKSICKDL